MIITAILNKKTDKSLCKNYVINHVILDEVDKTINNYVSIQNKKIDFYIIYCDCLIDIDNNFTTNIKTIYIYNTDITIPCEYFLYELNFRTACGYNVS